MQIRLRDYMNSPDGWGHAQGRQVYERLQDLVRSYPNEQIFAISLAGVHRTDASFPRESVVELARYYRPMHGFCLIDIADPDLLDNWDAAALKREQPLNAWMADDHRILGPAPSEGLREMFEYVLRVPSATTSEAAKTLNLKIPNASNKLKQLWEAGYILRRDRAASSGGVEYEYVRIC